MLARRVALIGVFASLHTLLYFMPLLWRSWAIFLIPFEGIILGPLAGYLAALMGSIIARIIKPDVFWMFGIFAEPLGVLAAGFLAKRDWKPVLAIYGVMLSAYFIHPLGRQLPLWTILDILLAFILIYPTAKIGRKIFEGNLKHSTISLIFISFISTVTDALIRVFLFIPVGLFSLLGLTSEAVYAIFIAGAIDSYIEDTLVVAVSFIIGTPLLKVLEKMPEFKYYS
ncbi:hypothetical protein KEJ34_05650 [Candidatus Bathyarchaeota archaeon]|nr:hypothetical protein [Candidatus Bathyarchaeota archaeon]